MDDAALQDTRSMKSPHYALRPAKNVERKMMCEAFRRLSGLRPVHDYRYIGFGALHFVDFLLFHRALGISDMVSIEGNATEIARYEFNCPLRCIKVRPGLSHTVLPQLPWDRPTILWLDYENQIDVRKLGDARTFVGNAPPGSVLVVTLPAALPREVRPGGRLQWLRNQVGADRVPDEVTEDSLGDWGLAEACRLIVSNEIGAALLDRNGTEPKAEQVAYGQLFNFRYRDSAHMCTSGGLLHRVQDEGTVAHCRFHELDFVRTGSDAYEIPDLKLTYRELRHLETHLPCDAPGSFRAPPVPAPLAQGYAKVYRYFPTFVEAEV
ncbi:MAG: hypothetical protein FJX75_09615 [Armatimonadetes bacterium]|nr:hypothetical protein [Armatimonadota bacterium]